ncbi:hypothetical protein DL96DRAFT_1064489 [Flagelloscypha sp. PMI_526]|nr:hypothetical protein DL96DRAFT_1064489 [Flagelloscypha sp. PMI_526]
MPSPNNSTSGSYELLPASEELNPNQPPLPTMGATRDFVRRGDSPAKWVSLGGASILLVVTWFLILTNDPTGKGWFAFHPLLITLALSLFTYGILTLQPTNTPTTKAAGLERHQKAIAYSAAPIFLLGVSAIWWNKERRGADHYTTWHGKFGSVISLVLLVQIFLGGGSVWFGGRLFGGGLKAKAVWKYHRVLGYSLLVFMLTTVHLGGVWSGWASHNTNFFIRLFAFTGAPLAILAGIAWRMRISKMPVF